MLRTMSHEMIHMAKQMSPGYFERYSDFIFDNFLSENADELIFRRQRQYEKANNGKKLSYNEAMEEVVADASEMFLKGFLGLKVELGNQAGEGRVDMETVTEDLQKPKYKGVLRVLGNVIERMKRKISAFKRAWNGAQAKTEEGKTVSAGDAKAYEQAQQMFNELILRASANYKLLKDGKWESEENQNKASFRDEIRDILEMSDDEAKRRKSEQPYITVLNQTPDVVLNHVKGAKNLPVIIRFDAAYLSARSSGALDGNYHDLGADFTDNLYRVLSDPEAIIRISENRINLIATIENKKGNNSIVSVEMDTVKQIDDKYKAYNLVVTFFQAKDNYARNLIKKATAVEYEKENLSQVNPQLHNSLGIINDRSSKNSVSDSGANVNTFPEKNSGNFENISEKSEKASIRGGAEGVKTAEEYFGTTYNVREAGYILLDGKMLDFSGRKDGAPGGYRTVDHRDILDAFDGNYGESGSDAMVQFMQAGNIRVMPESGGINLSVKPNAAQTTALERYISRFNGEVILDFDNKNGDTVASAEYKRFTSAKRILSDINAFFDEGIEPTGNLDIRYSERIPEEAAKYAKDFSDDVSEWYKKGMAEGADFSLGYTGDVLQGLGAMENEIYMKGDKIKTILNEHPEMTISEIQKIPQILRDPVLILKSRNVDREGKNNSRLVIFGSVKAQNGLPILSVLDLRPVENRLVIDDMQKVVSAYTKDYGEIKPIKSSEVLYVDEKRATRLLRSIGFYMPIELKRSGSIGSITYSKRNVNIFGKKFYEVFDIAGENTEKFSSRTFADSLTEPTKYQVRDGSTTDYVTSRLALADAFEQIATNQRERNWAARYRERAEELAGYNTRLRELWKDYFTKGHSAAERAEIRTQIRSLTQKIQTADGGGSKEKQGVKNTLFLNLQAAYSSDL